MKLRLGTRKSELARAQTLLVMNELIRRGSFASDLREVLLETSGDKKQNAPEETVRDKKDWIAELEDALLAEEIDLAVHSGKDVPVEIAAGTVLFSVLKRAPASDSLVARTGLSCDIRKLPSGAVLGTASERRKAQVKNLRPDIVVKPLRGNVPTRLRKLQSEGFDAIILATSGLNRLGQRPENCSELSILDFLPAVNQGILTVQLRAESPIENLLRALTDSDTELCFQVERKIIAALGADCHSAVGVYAEVLGDNVKILSRVYEKSGSLFIEESVTTSKAEGLSTAIELASKLIKRGAKRLL